MNGAISSFARAWTTGLKARHMRVNAISPGPIDTEGLRELFGSSPTGQERLKSISSTVPLGRLGKPEEIAKAAVFLASEDSSFITGVELFVDGGFAQVSGVPGRDIGVSAYLIARLVSIVSRARGIASLYYKESEEVVLARDSGRGFLRKRICADVISWGAELVPQHRPKLGTLMYRRRSGS